MYEVNASASVTKSLPVIEKQIPVIKFKTVFQLCPCDRLISFYFWPVSYDVMIRQTKWWEWFRNISTRDIAKAQVQCVLQSSGGCDILLQSGQMCGDVTPVNIPQQEHWLLSSLTDSPIVALSYVLSC